MLTAQQLTERVAASSADRTAFRGVSDHMFHAQRVCLAGCKPLTLATWNVLNPKYVKYQSGIPRPGEKMPSEFNLETQQGLEALPMLQPSRQAEREKTVLVAIVQFMVAAENPVLCLQECWPELATVLRTHSAECGFNVLQVAAINELSEAFKLILVSSHLQCSVVQAQSAFLTVVLPEQHCYVSNVHLCFHTEVTLKALEQCIAADRSCHFVLGDFNVQTKPLSTTAISEGSTLTLAGLATELETRHGLSPRFALHPLHWTNWNIRKNCADPASNWDHFDNIMHLSTQPEQLESVRGIEVGVLMME